MSRPKLFEYVIIWHPTLKQVEEENKKSQVVVPLQIILATDPTEVTIAAAIKIPEEYKTQLDQLVIAVRPF